MSGLRALGVLYGALGVAFALEVGACLLPENDYQRWQLLDGTIYEHLRWTYERIHFDPRPIDVAIVGPSRTQLGLSAARIEQQLSSQGRPANVANFSLEAEGRNIDWAIIRELYKTKSPKLIVIGIDAAPYPYGHPAFKYVAPGEAIVFPPEPFLHNYFYDLAYLPVRKARLFGARFFPDLFGLGKPFDPDAYAHTRTDFTTTFVAEGRRVDMDHEVPRATLIAQAPAPKRPSFVSRLLTWCCNEGDDHAYIREIARLAKAHDARLIFVFVPFFNGPTEISDRAFLEQFGSILNQR